MLRGEHGRQAKELARLIAWIREGERPDVLCLNNGMLVGLARQIRHEVDLPIACTLQGEDTFLDSLPDGYRDQAWGELRHRATEVDAFIAVSRHHAEVMRRRLNVPQDRMHVVYNGIVIDDLAPPDVPPTPPTIGYLARMHPGKGMHTLAEAFAELKRDGKYTDVRLHLAGSQPPSDRRYVRQVQAQLDAAGVSDHVVIEPNVSRERKIELLRSFSAFSVPAAYGESFGLYVLEAWAAGVPVVEPRSAGLGEVVAAVGGGLLCEPDDAVSLAAGLKQLLDAPAEAQRLGRIGREAVEQRFTDRHMAMGVAQVLERVAGVESARHG
jgi:glycosyltransferase involved in cell wall biosynthesis